MKSQRKKEIIKKEDKENKNRIIHSKKKKNKRSKRKRTNELPQGVKSTKLALKCPFAYQQGIDFDLYQECNYCTKFKACKRKYVSNKRNKVHK